MQHDILVMIIGGLAAVLLFCAGLISNLMRDNRKSISDKISDLNKKLDEHTKSDEGVHREIFQKLNTMTTDIAVIKNRVNGELLKDIKKVFKDTK